MAVVVAVVGAEVVTVVVSIAFQSLKRSNPTSKKYCMCKTMFFPEVLNDACSVDRRTVFKMELEEHVFGFIEEKKHSPGILYDEDFKGL